MEWEKILANDAIDNGLIAKMYKQLIQQQKTETPIKKQTFLQRRYTDGQQALEKMLNVTNYQRNANENYK